MKIEETVREDGLRVISCRTSSKAVHVEFLAGVGSAYDPPGKEGSFHIWEHMAFKGTTTRTVEEIASFMRKNLVLSNAYTAQTEIGYWGKSVYTKLPKLFEFLADMYFHASLPPDELERERGVVLSEIAAAEDDDSMRARRALYGSLWTVNPLRTYGVGTPEGIRSVNRPELIAARDYWYVPSNTTVLAVGNVEHDTLLELAYAHIPLNPEVVLHKTWDDEYGMLPPERTITLTRQDRKQGVVVVGCKFPSFTDERMITVASCMGKLLAGGPGSILWTEVRERRGLVYGIGGGVQRRPPLGSYFGVLAETSSENIETVRDLVTTHLTIPIAQKRQFEEVQELAADKCVLGIEELSQWAELIKETIKMNKPVGSLERFFSRRKKLIASITPEEVEELRKRTLTPERFVTVIIKPV